MQWIEIEPFDTLFFRGGEPMEAGETHEAGIPVFPPIPETIIGAIRTAILSQRGINLSSLERLGDNEDLDAQRLPFWGTPSKSGFWIIGPLLKVRGVFLFPAPANWFYSESNCSKDRLEVYEARPVQVPQVRTSREKLLWVKNPPENMESLLRECWLTRKALENKGTFGLEVAKTLDDITDTKPLAVPTRLLVYTEERVGIAKDYPSRVVKQGYLYATRHLRLGEGVSLVVGLDKPLCPSHLNDTGVFQLGGEGRMVRYWALSEKAAPHLPNGQEGRLLAISPLKYSKAKQAGLLNLPYASGKLMRVAGWDMKKGFHKPAEAYFPAGSVFFADKTELNELIAF